MDQGCVLLDERAYVMESSTARQLMELEAELESIDHEYTTLFELEALYHYYAGVGMKANVISVIAQLQIGNECVITLQNSSMKITRVSKSFCVGEWLQVNYNYNEATVHDEEHYYEDRQLLCN